MSNVFSFTGHVGRDAEVRSLPSGQSLLNFTVANTTGFGDKKKTMWVQCTVWGKLAEGNFKNCLTKGQHVFVSGELSQREYQHSDGSNKTSIELNVSIIDLVGGKREESDSPQKSEPKQKSAPIDDFNDDIPF